MSILKVDELQSRTSGNRITLPEVNNYPPYRNLIINGDMSLAQRGTSTASITSDGYYTIDRWQTSIVNQGTWTQSQDTDVPSGQGFATSLKMDCTTADASPASGDRLFIRHKFEGQILQQLKKGTSNAESLTLSFWVKSNKTGTYIAELFDVDNARQISKAYTISSASTWEKKTLTFAGDTTGAFDNDNELSLQLAFWLGSGSDYNSGTLSTLWTSNNSANRAVGQVNLADNTSNEWYITGVQLEVGDSATPFEHIPYDVNLQRCQRYYFKISSADAYGPYGMGHGVNTTSFRVIINTPVTMRAQPSLGFSAASNFIWSFGNVLTGITSAEYSTDSFSVSCNTTGVSANGGYLLTAGNNSNSYIEASSEL